MIRLWAAGELTMKLLLSIKTAKEFAGYREDEQTIMVSVMIFHHFTPVLEKVNRL